MLLFLIPDLLSTGIVPQLESAGYTSAILLAPLPSAVANGVQDRNSGDGTRKAPEQRVEPDVGTVWQFNRIRFGFGSWLLCAH